MNTYPTKYKYPYTDEELRDILSHSPTTANIKMLMEKYYRTENALREIFRFANYSKKRLKEKGYWNSFTIHIKQICIEIGLMKLPS